MIVVADTSPINYLVLVEQILGRADEQDLTPDLPHILKRLESETNFRIHRPAVDLLLARHRGGTNG